MGTKVRPFRPARVYVTEEALKYPLAHEMVTRFEEAGIPTQEVRRVPGISADSVRQGFFEAKRTLVLAVRRKSPLQGCRPSANWQLPFISGCPGHCHYCYLNTSFGLRPYVRVYVNVDEILEHAESYIEDRAPFVTIFEGAATSDPIPLEHWTHTLQRAIEHFGRHPYGRFRIVTKYDDVGPLLHANHRLHTRIRFTVNTKTVISRWDKATASLDRRLKAAKKVADAGYLFGFIIGPIVIYPGWEKEYKDLIQQIAEEFPSDSRKRMSVEMVTHRFTPKAKELIEQVYTDTDLPMLEDDRQWRYGQFGYGKWVYPKEAYQKVKEVVKGTWRNLLPEVGVMYIV